MKIRTSSRKNGPILGLQTFDPKNAEHRRVFLKFLACGKIDRVDFELEGYRDLPAMMLHKMALYGAGALDKLDVVQQRREKMKVVQKAASV